MNDKAQGKPRKKKPYRKKPNNSDSAAKSNNNRNRKPKILTAGRLIQKYDNLLEQHILARKKYFEMYARLKGKHLKKIVDHFSHTLKSLSTFQNNLKDWQKETLDKKLNFYPLDLQYSSTHQDEQPEIISFDTVLEDPHLLPTQKNHQWSEDTEESVGTIEDYEKYKEQN